MPGQGVTGYTNVSAKRVVNEYGRQSAKASDSSLKISTGTRLIRPSVDASSSAITSKLSTNIKVLTQASRNVSQAISVLSVVAGAQSNIIGLLSDMKALTTKSNDGSNDGNSRALINSEYSRLLDQVDAVASQARWNGVSLLSASNATASMAGAVTLAVNNIGTPVANTMNAAPVDTTNSRGFITGVFTDATVVANSNQYQVTLTMKNSTPGGEVTQTFTGLVGAPAAGGSFALSSTTDDRNVLVMDYDAADVSGISNAATFQTALRTVLNIGTGLIGTSVLSGSTAVNNGVSSVAAAANTAAGTYALEYDGVSEVMKLTTGEQKWEVTMTAAGAQTVTFTNGVTVSLGAGFALATSATQMVFDVGTGGSVAMTFQIAENSSDVLTANIPGASSSNLGINGTDVSSQAGAQSAGNLLDAAIQSLNTSFAQIGASQRQLESSQENLKATIENAVAARAIYSDADISEEMTELTQAQVFSQLSTAMLTQQLEAQKGLVSVVR